MPRSVLRADRSRKNSRGDDKASRGESARTVPLRKTKNARDIKYATRVSLEMKLVCESPEKFSFADRRSKRSSVQAALRDRR